MKGKLADIPTQELIDELNGRDLFKELDKEKRDWLLKNGFRQITKYQFMDANRAMLYSLERLQNSALAENQKKYLVAKAIRESLLQPGTPSESTIAHQSDEEPEHPRPKDKSHHPQNRCEPNHLSEEKCKDLQDDRKSAPEKEA